MLVNSLDEVLVKPSLLSILETSKYKFYLTGSRYFVKYATVESSSEKTEVSKNTDYDYFIEYDESVLQYLLDLGFDYLAANEYSKQSEILEDKYMKGVMIGSKYTFYNDQNIVGVCFSPCRTIDIQLVKNLQLKKEVQRILSCMGYHYYNLSKPDQKWLWDQQYKRICKERNITL